MITVTWKGVDTGRIIVKDGAALPKAYLELMGEEVLLGSRVALMDATSIVFENKTHTMVDPVACTEEPYVALYEGDRIEMRYLIGSLLYFYWSKPATSVLHPILVGIARLRISIALGREVEQALLDAVRPHEVNDFIRRDAVMTPFVLSLEFREERDIELAAKLASRLGHERALEAVAEALEVKKMMPELSLCDIVQSEASG